MHQDEKKTDKKQSVSIKYYSAFYLFNPWVTSETLATFHL